MFRDDVVFLIFLYQRWIYPVDKTRVNEFGYTEDGPQTQEGQQGASGPAATPAAAAEGDGSKPEGKEEERPKDESKKDK